MKSLANYEEIPISIQKIIMDSDIDMATHSIVWKNSDGKKLLELKNDKIDLIRYHSSGRPMNETGMAPGVVSIVTGECETDLMGGDITIRDLSSSLDSVKASIITTENIRTGVTNVLTDEDVKVVSLSVEGGLNLVDQNLDTTGKVTANIVHATTYENLPESG